ncbi:hypothetical protein F511_26112 [Dorcoceras hygrometricum]|uniref:CCHC-type domain-containing protein n=1 Tax=Dorcoceras hygrometricum TaxID=472368 RepID=A0A2Z7DAZ1_9LAMI|nr:hypothetical protein F511_26112 [Dorcoceras hygrometricum]
MVNVGQRSCACDWLCWYVATGTRRGKRVLRLDNQQLVLRIEHPMRRRLDRLVRRRFEDQSMVCFVIDFSVRSTGCQLLYFETASGCPAARDCFYQSLRDFSQGLLLLSIRYGFELVLQRSYGLLRLLPESSGFLTGFVVAQYKDVRASGDTALSSPCWDRSHHEPSGNPGSTAGRGFNPAGGAPGGSSGSGSSSSSGSRAEFCGFCGGKHSSTQCVGVQGSYNLCGQYGHFARVCPTAGAQQTTAQPQGRGGQPRGRSQQFQQPRFGEAPFRPFQQPGPSRFGQSSQPFFPGPQQAQETLILAYMLKKLVAAPVTSS